MIFQVLQFFLNGFSLLPAMYKIVDYFAIQFWLVYFAGYFNH